MITVNNEFSIKDVVFLKTDPQQYDRIVTGIIVRNREVTYELMSETEASEHFDYEISATKIY